jgi:excisionase family DNA binding protein
MSQVLYSVDQVAERLGLHVRTVRGYVRDGRLKALRIGKSYRIAHEDLETFLGRPVAPDAAETVRRQRHVEVSSIVQIDAVSPDQASRMTNGLMGATNSRGRGEGDTPLRVDTIYDEGRGRLKIIITGGVQPAVWLLQLVTLYLE